MYVNLYNKDITVGHLKVKQNENHKEFNGRHSQFSTNIIKLSQNLETFYVCLYNVLKFAWIWKIKL